MDMNEYEFKYEASPVSEIVKVKIIKADNIDIALQLFREVYKIKGEIFAIQSI